MEQTNLPERLKELRNDRNYSQAYVAQQLNISRQTYSHYETGRINPPTDSLRALAELYNISMDLLIPIQTKRNTYYHTISDAYIPDLQTSKGYNKFAQENRSKLRSLSNSEKHLLYYYSLLDTRDQKDILAFMKLKSINRRNEKS